jgi:hypothetical protein
MTIFSNAVSAWIDILGVIEPPLVMETEHQEERGEDGKLRMKVVQTIITKGVYRHVQGKTIRYLALGFPGDGKKIRLYWGPSKEEALETKAKWDKENVAKIQTVPKISLTYFP